VRHNPQYFIDDPEVVRQLIRENPWGTLVSVNGGRLVASHYPVLLDEESEELAAFTHVGRPDEEIHGFGDREILLIVQGVHGYISPSWYVPRQPGVPTWNFAVAHCHGVPEVLDAETNLRSLARLVEHFERRVEEPMLLDLEWAPSLAKGTVGIRLPITRFECKLKMSQNMNHQSRRRVIQTLRAPGAYQNPRLADEMQHALADT
jgi:transcriptional regulator